MIFFLLFKILVIQLQRLWENSCFLFLDIIQGIESGEYEDEYDRLLIDCFLELNEIMNAEVVLDGTTGLVALCLGTRVWIANAGDSRAVLCRYWMTLTPSLPHSPFSLFACCVSESRVLFPNSCCAMYFESLLRYFSFSAVDSDEIS